MVAASDLEFLLMHTMCLRSCLLVPSFFLCSTCVSTDKSNSMNSIDNFDYYVLYLTYFAQLELIRLTSSDLARPP